MKTFIQNGKSVTIDDEDAHFLEDHTFHVSSSGARKKWYVKVSMSGGYIYLHRLILSPIADDLQVDHIDGDGLNNTRSNLRLCTLKENARNSRIRKDNSSGFKGVSNVTNSKKFQARIKCGGKTIHLGCFDDPSVAHQAYREAARELFGEFSRFE